MKRKLVILVGGLFLLLSFAPVAPKIEQNSDLPSLSDSKARAAAEPRLYISGGSGYISGGVVALSSTQSPTITFSSYGEMSGTASVDLYSADEQSMLKYLVYNEQNKQVNTEVDTNQMRFVSNFSVKIEQNSDQKVNLPISESGIWFLHSSLNGHTDKAFVIRSNTGVVVKEGESQYIFWAQDFKTKRSALGGNLRLYNLQNTVSLLDTASIGANGIATTAYNESVDLAMFELNGDSALIPINLTYFDYNYRPFGEKSVNRNYYVFTDRTIYRPGDRVYFKSIIRDDVEGVYNLPTGLAQVSIMKDWDETNPLFQKNYPISSFGTVDGFIDMPADSRTGSYQIKISTNNQTPGVWAQSSYAYFTLDYYRKPEYSIEVSVPKMELVAGDDLNFNISGNYFFGQPLSNQKVDYKIFAGEYYEYSYSAEELYFDDNYRYGYWGSEEITNGSVSLDEKGQATVHLDSKFTKGYAKPRVFSIEASYADESQNQSFSRKNVLVYPGEFSIYKNDWSYATPLNLPYSLSLTLRSHRGTSVAGVKLSAKVKREYWQEVKDPLQKYSTYNMLNEETGAISSTTDSSGKAVLTFTPKQTGNYVFSVSAEDQRGNLVNKDFDIWVPDQYYSYYNQNYNDENRLLTINTDKDEYAPGDTATLYISSVIPDRDVLLTIDREDVNRYQVISLNGRSGQATISVSGGDIPRIFPNLSSFSDTDLNSGYHELKVSAASKKLVVKLTPQKEKYGPGDTVTLNVKTTDNTGRSVSAEVAVWTIDKALYELMDQKPENVFDHFWAYRYDQTQQSNSLAGILTRGGAERGGCFAADTSVTMADGSTKFIQDIKVGEEVLSKDLVSGKVEAKKVKNVHSTVVDGHLIINEELKVTPNHLIFLNNIWQPAGNVQVGDTMIDSSGRAVNVESLEWQLGKTQVYNLEVADFHTYFAQGVWVHNQKGDGGGARSVFKDTAYWNPSVRTDSQGSAQVSFKLPDNLTTWVISGIGTTVDTVVGDNKVELVVGKDIIARPVLPNIMRVDDEMIVSGLIHNFTDQRHTINISMAFDSGDIQSQSGEKLTIPPKGFEQAYWKVIPKKENDAAQITLKATAEDNASLTDTIVQKIPIRRFGYWDKAGENKNNAGAYSIKLHPDDVASKTKIKLTLAPALLGTLPSAMEYLVSYPYGCVEQTTSHFVPALIAKQNPDLYREALADKDIDDIIKTGLKKLVELQQMEGGWQWWREGNSDPFITSYVVEYLVLAKNLGYTVDATMLQQAQSYLERTDGTTDQIVSKVYALTLLGSNSEFARKRLTDLTGLTPDLIAMAAMANARNGYGDLVATDMAQLRNMVQYQGDGAYWGAGKGIYFGSEDASTAMVARALMLSHTDQEFAGKAVRYLINHRRGSYWSNTYATAQVIRAVTELARTENSAVNYSYNIKLDGTTIKSGVVSSIFDSVSVNIAPTTVKPSGSSLQLEQIGNGQMYSTLTIDQYRSSKEDAYIEHGVKIKREYKNKTHPYSPLAVGDVVTVNLSVEGLNPSSDNEFTAYGVIEDQLPSGLVAINKNLKNEQASENYDLYRYYFSYYDFETTESGVILSPYGFGSSSYSYDARVVSAGKFDAPPAYVELMYSPEIYGRSEATPIEVLSESPNLPAPLARLGVNSKRKLIELIIAVLILIGLGALGWFLKKRDAQA